MRIQKSLVLGVFVIVSLFNVVPVVGAVAPIYFETIGATNPRAFGFGYPNDSSIHDIAQRYMPPAAQELCKVSSYFQTYTGPNIPDITLRVFKGGTNPTNGILLQSVTVDKTHFGGTSFAHYTEWNLNTCITLSPNTNYWFVFSVSQYNTASMMGLFRNSDQAPNTSYYEQTEFQERFGLWSEFPAREWAIKLEGPEPPKLTPVLIIPGILGTELGQGNDLIWANLAKMLLDPNDGFVSGGLALDSDGHSVNQITVGTILSKVELVGAITLQDLFDGLTKKLEASNYSQGEDYFVFPYDWRFDLEETKNLLKQKIDAIKAQTGSTKVDIIAHSMGGLLVKDYLNQYGKGDVSKLIFVGTPHLGAPKAAKALLVGDRFNIPMLAESAMRAVALNAPAVYELLPNPTYFDKFTGYLKKADSTDPLNYADTENFLVSSGLNWNLIDRASSFFNKDLADIDLSGIDVYNIAGCRTSTQAGYQFNNDNTEIIAIRETSGDKTVPLPSADYLNVPSDHKFYFKDGKHSELPSVEPVRNLILDILKNASTTASDTLAQGDSSFCDFKGKELLWHSPVEIHVYDELGNHTGPVADNVIEYNIPGVDYEIIGHNKFVFVPTDTGHTYHVVANGLDSGTFDLFIRDNDNGEITKTTLFNDIPISTESHAEAEVGDATLDNTIELFEAGQSDGEKIEGAEVADLSAGDVPVVIETPPILDDPQTSSSDPIINEPETSSTSEGGGSVDEDVIEPPADLAPESSSTEPTVEGSQASSTPDIPDLPSPDPEIPPLEPVTEEPSSTDELPPVTDEPTQSGSGTEGSADSSTPQEPEVEQPTIEMDPVAAPSGGGSSSGSHGRVLGASIGEEGEPSIVWLEQMLALLQRIVALMQQLHGLH